METLIIEMLSKKFNRLKNMYSHIKITGEGFSGALIENWHPIEFDEFYKLKNIRSEYHNLPVVITQKAKDVAQYLNLEILEKPPLCSSK
jgi:hypothetical protein